MPQMNINPLAYEKISEVYNVSYLADNRIGFLCNAWGVQGKRKNCAKHNPRHCVDRTGCPGAKGDSVVYREKVVIRPHIFNVGDTTITLMDTTIVNSTERTVMETNNYYYGSGKTTHDTTFVEARHSPEQAKSDTNSKQVHKWRLLCMGIIIGLLIATCYKYQESNF